jgi:hypothetical protein
MNIPSRHSPFTPPDWRYLRARYLVEEGKRPSRRDDQATLEAWRFFRRLGRCDDQRQRERVRRRWPHLAAAVELHKDADALRRAELEGRLLARQPVDVVAGRLGLSPGAVGAYCSLYFDVLKVLDAGDYIVLQVIGLSPSRTVSEKDAGTWVRLFGWLGGPHVLESVLDFYKAPEAVPADLTSVEPARRARLVQQLTIRSSILLNTVPDGDARLLLVQCLFERQEADRRNEEIVGHDGDLLPPVCISSAELEGLVALGRASKAAAGRAAG